MRIIQRIQSSRFVSRCGIRLLSQVRGLSQRSVPGVAKLVDSVGNLVRRRQASSRSASPSAAAPSAMAPDGVAA
ncbi:hypothetical protein TPA0598_03_07360 [Streptomyces lydicamycinicus]|uniref:Uncharacterized protein n=1 Tax=Streptomyces lydicamycinicus TaxID=1546107 RepID=A0A0N7YLA6_9ACTN|nr:hypothetical protein TPA0598_03_07360 [Streptomyces lydicamycinicus]